MEPLAEQRKQIRNLPVEVIEMILNSLTVSDLKNASLVCRLWSDIAFPSHRMDCVLLKVDLNKDPERYTTVLSKSVRQYRHIWLNYNSGRLTYINQVLQTFKHNIISLTVRSNKIISLSHLRDILLEVPNLRALSVQSGLWQPAAKFVVPAIVFPVLHQLSNFKLERDTALRYWPNIYCKFDIRLIAPNLRSLSLQCDSQRAFEVYKHFSNQLNSVTVFFNDYYYFLRFCGLNFPNLYTIDLDGCMDEDGDDNVIRPMATFFARSNRLQQATLRCNFPQPILHVLVDNCPDLRYLRIKLYQLENQTFIHLAHLTKLKVLVLEHSLKCKLFDGCNPLLSLEELHLHSVKIYEDDALEFFKSLSKITPTLRVLHTIRTDLDDYCLRFICSNFLTLQKLSLDSSECTFLTTNGFGCLNQLPNLRELCLEHLSLPRYSLKMIQSNKISNFSLRHCDKLTDEDLLEIPRGFPVLAYLEIVACHLITPAGIQKLRFLIPWCTISRRES